MTWEWNFCTELAANVCTMFFAGFTWLSLSDGPTELLAKSSDLGQLPK